MVPLRPTEDFERGYQQDQSILPKAWPIKTIIAIIIAWTIPLWGSAWLVTTANQIAYTIIALQGLNMLTGYTGQISLGQAAFMLVGGYISALVTIHFGIPFFGALVIAAIGTGLVGLIFGLPSLRVKGFYLAMATLAAQFIIPWLTRQTFPEYLGGTSGRIDVPVPYIGDFAFNQVSRFYYLTFAILLITTILVFNISRTRLGRAFVSIRDNELAAEQLGIKLFAYKLRAFAIAAMLAGVAGSLKATSQRGVGTEFGYALEESVIYLGMLVIGGLGTNLGPFLGATAIILLEELAKWVGAELANIFPDLAASLLTSFRPIFFGLVLMLFLIFEPRGLAHRWQLTKAAWRERRLTPFSR